MEPAPNQASKEANAPPAKKRLSKKDYVFRPLKTKSFWTVIEPGQNLPFLDKEPKAGNYFYISKYKDQPPLLRYFELIDNFLVLRQSSDKKAINYLNLSYIYFKRVPLEQGKKRFFGLLMYNLYQHDFIMTDKERLILKWEQLFLPFCIGINFQKNYLIDKSEFLGRGTYGNVYKVTLNNGGTLLNQRAVKIYNKANVLKPEVERVDPF